jgi:hypothetical protein
MEIRGRRRMEGATLAEPNQNLRRSKWENYQGRGVASENGKNRTFRICDRLACRRPAIKRRYRNAEILCNVSWRHASGKQHFCRFDLAVCHLPFSTATATQPLGGFQACPCSLNDELPLHLSEARHDVKEESAWWRVLVSIESERLLKLIPCRERSLVRSTRYLTLRPNRSSFQTTRGSPSRSISRVLVRPGLSARLPLILSSYIF